MRYLIVVSVFVVACSGASPVDVGADASIRDRGHTDVDDFDGGDFDVGAFGDVGDGGLADADAADTQPAGTWRSSLFPADWRPLHSGGITNTDGLYLPDFSSAGWHRGEHRPPVGQGAPRVVVSASLGDGTTDATSDIQAAIDTVCGEGGGVVLLPTGTYRIRLPTPTASAALEIRCSGLVLRGEGPSRTRLLFDDPTRARQTAVIRARGAGTIRDGANPRTMLTVAAIPTSRTVEVASAAGFAVGQVVVVRSMNTPRFRIEHRMDEATSELSGLWPDSRFWGLAYPRRIERIDGLRVTLDGPIHYPLRTEDGAVLQSLASFINEVGLESFAIGMVENRTSPQRLEPGSDNDYTIEGTTGYEVHSSRIVELDAVYDAWIHDVDTFQPEGNTTGAHVLSNGFLLEEGAFRVTVSDCDLAWPQYRGGGGNGYLLHLQGHDALIVDSTASMARHGFTINHSGSGNVLLRATLSRNRFSDDAHRFLANANLFDGTTLDDAWLQAVNRGVTSSGAGFTATQHVYWRTRVVTNHARADGCAVESAQWGNGYLIGSSSATGEMARLCPTSFSNSTWASLDLGDPQDFVEGEGEGATLWPISLYAAQLAERCTREGLECTSSWSP